MLKERFFYHSFPRVYESNLDRTALTIIESVIDRGLLLTPEHIQFREELTDGKLSQQINLWQKRISFTELEPNELVHHSSTFGQFAFEWKVNTLIQMGAVPVFYVPLHTDTGGFDGLASSLLARICEIQLLLDRLGKLQTLIEETSDKKAFVNLTNSEKIIGQTQITIEDSQRLLQFLETDIQPISILLAAIKALSGYFYPTENLTYTDLLGYYRQREWRLISGSLYLGEPITVDLEDEDVEALIKMDKKFFGKAIDFPSGRRTRATGCQLYRNFQGSPIIETCSRIICPQAAKSKVENLLSRKKIELDVVAIEDYSSASE